MNKQNQQKPIAVKRTNRSAAKPQSSGKRLRKAKKEPVKHRFFQKLVNGKRKLPLVGFEIFSLAIALVAIIMVMLGYSAGWFSGTRFFASLLPFAVFTLGLIVLTAVLLIGWWQLRKRLQQLWPPLSSVVAVVFALGIVSVMLLGRFNHGFENFRNLVGGRQEDRRITLAHQVYAAYRRSDTVQLQKMIDRAQQYAPVIREAARAFDVDVNLLEGIAAAESSFLPRQSKDGGKGLFQITQMPDAVIKQVERYLDVDALSLNDPRQNAYVAAAELKYYLAEMDENLFLGLLAYNIGPANGGLRFIMRQYGVTNFVTIQPYLKQLPRDYPIRVLSYSLAFRLWQQRGKLLAYEEGQNARIIQRIGIPGLEGDE
jgi:Transglycosylase SLT domain